MSLRHAKNPTLGIVLTLLFFPLALALFGQEASCESAPLRIGVLISYDQTLPWAQSFIRGLAEAQALSGQQIEFFIEYVDVRRFSSFFQGETFSKYLREKYGRVRQRGVNSGVLEVAIGQAALGGIWAGCASLGWVLSSAMASTCM